MVTLCRDPTKWNTPCTTDNNNNNINNNNNFKIIQQISEQNTEKARNQGSTENSHIGHCTQTAGSANVKVQNM